MMKTPKSIVASLRNVATQRLSPSTRSAIVFALLMLVISVTAIVIEASMESRNSSADQTAEPLISLPDHPRHLINFSLTDESGHPVNRMDFQGKIVVVNFLFTSCSTVCPYVTAQMSEVQRLTAKNPDVKLLSLTVDPVDDTVPVLAEYARKTGADQSRWTFATGDGSVMENLIETSFLSHDTNSDFGAMPGNFAHSERIVLVDQDGQVVKYFDGLNEKAAHAIVQEIEKLSK